jgi:hypothetical protein
LTECAKAVLDAVNVWHEHEAVKSAFRRRAWHVGATRSETMSTSIGAAVRPFQARWPTLLLAALVVGALDMGMAMGFWHRHGVPPVRVLQSVAAGLMGPAAFAGGSAAAVLGLLLHLTIAGLMVLAYDLVALRLRWLVRRPWLAGPLYGGVLYLVMTWVVVPLSAAPHAPASTAWNVASVLSHVLLVGLPCALFVRTAQLPTPPHAGDALRGAS